LHGDYTDEYIMYPEYVLSTLFKLNICFMVRTGWGCMDFQCFKTEEERGNFCNSLQSSS